jgi:hypothetical protein
MPKVQHECKQCGIHFEIFPSQIRKGGGIFCSRRCHNIMRGKEDRLSGKIFGRLVVIKKITRKWPGRSSWLCKCECGKEKDIVASSLTSGRTKSCGCLLISTPWKGYQNISGDYWNRLKKSAKLRNIEFSISMEYAWTIYIRQNKKCSLTGRDIVIDPSYLRSKILNRTGQQTASIDRINNKDGYIKGNIQWVHVDINYMKQDYTQEYFIESCREIYINATKKPQ